MWSRLERLQNAHVRSRENHRALVTHPFHPLSGQNLEVVDRRRFQDGERVYLEVEPGNVVRMPSEWTSLGPMDPLVALSEGRSLFRVDDLLRLARLIVEVGGRDQGAKEKEGA